jgi:hypothetical protein
MSSLQDSQVAPRDDPLSASWNSLVRRSVQAWGTIKPADRPIDVPWGERMLALYSSLDELLQKAPVSFMFWFFQTREAFLSQKTMTKWSRDSLDGYILMPASNGWVTRAGCMFVSHYWRTKVDPDPDGKYLKLIQEELKPQSWSFIWVDWSCLPQEPRGPREENYFWRGLETMSGIIRNAGFMWYYPPFEPRLWILYEIAEYNLTCDAGITLTDDNKEFVNHIQEMDQLGVRCTLDKHGYRCSDQRDREFIIAWLELHFLLRKLNLDVGEMRRVLDHMIWFRVSGPMTWGTSRGVIELWRHEGRLTLNGNSYTLTPFPQWVC